MSDWNLTVHDINGQQVNIRYLGNGEWQVGDRTVLFSGDKHHLLKDLRKDRTKRRVFVA